MIGTSSSIKGGWIYLDKTEKSSLPGILYYIRLWNYLTFGFPHLSRTFAEIWVCVTAEHVCDVMLNS